MTELNVFYIYVPHKCPNNYQDSKLFLILFSFKIGRIKCTVTIFSTLKGLSLFHKADTTKEAGEKTHLLLLLAAGTENTTRKF